MKYLVLFCALAAVGLSQVFVEDSLVFNFEGTDGVSEPQPFDLPFYYGGTVNISIQEPKTDLLLCVHWVVPVVAPFGVSLDGIWDSTCTFFQAVPGNAPFSVFDVDLRSGGYYVTASIIDSIEEDTDSIGIMDSSYDFSATFTYQVCDTNKFGKNCADEFSELFFGDNQISLSGSALLYFSLSTSIQGIYDNLPFQFPNQFKMEFTHDGDEKIDYTMEYRLMGSPEDFNDGKECKSSSSCSIPNPSFSYTPGYKWGITLLASEDVNATVTINPTFCKENEIGSDCEEYKTLNTPVGEVKKYSKKTIFVFDSSVSIAVGGLNGYEQVDAPDVDVQIDAAPVEKSKNNVLVSKGALVNTAIFQLSTNSSKIVVTVDPTKSFGIWKVDDQNQCPNDCEVHGTCQQEEYSCKCDSDDYEDLACNQEVKDFTVEYIILIAVGSILILAIIIGVPIYCYLNRKQEYDIVA